MEYAQKEAERAGMDIVYQDKRIVVAVKPAGVVSTDETGGMPDLLRQELQTACIRTVHRLDAPAGCTGGGADGVRPERVRGG